MEIVCGFTVTVAEACSAGTDALVAVIVAVELAFSVAGALYTPDLEIEPGPETLQFTVLSVTPVRVAENCVLPPA